MINDPAISLQLFANFGQIYGGMGYIVIEMFMWHTYESCYDSWRAEAQVRNMGLVVHPKREKGTSVPEWIVKCWRYIHSREDAQMVKGCD